VIIWKVVAFCDYSPILLRLRSHKTPCFLVVEEDSYNLIQTPAGLHHPFPKPCTCHINFQFGLQSRFNWLIMTERQFNLRVHLDVSPYLENCFYSFNDIDWKRLHVLASIVEGNSGALLCRGKTYRSHWVVNPIWTFNRASTFGTRFCLVYCLSCNASSIYSPTYIQPG